MSQLWHVELDDDHQYPMIDIVGPNGLKLYMSYEASSYLVRYAWCQHIARVLTTNVPESALEAIGLAVQAPLEPRRMERRL
jgi:hypothetical protein